jgi:hypothetical protein
MFCDGGISLNLLACKVNAVFKEKSKLEEEEFVVKMALKMRLVFDGFKPFYYNYYFIQYWTR